MIGFGIWSIILLIGAVQGLFISVCLFLKATNREANTYLAGLIVLLCLKLVPYILGYAGFYRVYPWLDLAPFDLSLGLGPLLFLYIARLIEGRMPKHWTLHLIPLGVQFAVYLALFLQPLVFKQHFEDTIGPTFNRGENLMTCLSLIGYMGLTWRMVRRYQSQVVQTLANPEIHPLRPLSMNVFVISITLGAFTCAILWTIFIWRLTYYQMFPFYLLLVIAVYALGFIAFKFSNVEPLFQIDILEPKEINWAELAADYNSALVTMSFWSDPTLSISMAAKKLGTTESRLSRSVNLGLGMSFSTWINTYRIEQAALRLISDDQVSVMEIANQCGFNSKASFNRWFKTVKGCTPTEFRASKEVSLPSQAQYPVQPKYHSKKENT